MHLWTAALFVAGCAQAAHAAPQQAPMLIQPSTQPLGRTLHGRFLQVTDLHPDMYYKNKASASSACHRKKPKKEKPRSRYWGLPYDDCDSPLRLTDFVLDFLDEYWTSHIDFVVWTGDNARHDSDSKIPRTPSEIYETNSAIASRMQEVFLDKGIPVIPSLGNNDVWPHNIMTPGPNSITNEFSKIWKSFIPFPSYQVFQRGAYFSVEVVPNALAVISLNTMYFYDSNKAVRGCEWVHPDDPGNLQFDWLEVQLGMYRSRNVKVWLTGHVPPAPGNFFPECYVRYVELSLRFQDTILGHLYGHKNADHFSLLESSDLQIWPKASSEGSGPGIMKHPDIYETLLNDFEYLSNASKKLDHDNYAIINVSPSVVPNPYLPSFRIYTYNATQANAAVRGDAGGAKKSKKGHRHGNPANKDKKCKEKPYRDTWKCRLKAKWHSDPHAPSRTNTLWTPLGYAQYYIPNLDTASKKRAPKFKLEYLTFPLDALHPSPNETSADFEYPIPPQHLPRSLRNGSAISTSGSKYAPYQMKDLTVPSWLKLASKLGDPERGRLRRKFKKFMYMGRGEEG